MANNYLITGYWGEPHVTAENDRGINAAIFGTGRFVLPVGEQFRAEYIGNNTVRLYDGKLMDNGAAAGIPAGEYVDLLIPNASQGMNRSDIIVFQYSKDGSTLIESGTFVLVQGTETSGTATDPTLMQEDLLTDEASTDQMALWRVAVSGAAIAAPVQLFTVAEPLSAKAPDGYGLGKSVPRQIETLEALDTLVENGWHRLRVPDGQGSLTVAGVDVSYCSVYNERYSPGQGLQRLTTPYGLQVQRIMSGYTWGAWENVNPPMALGVEYRTTERYEGKPVYTKLVDCGNITNGKTVTAFPAECYHIRWAGRYGVGNSWQTAMPAVGLSADGTVLVYASAFPTGTNILLYCVDWYVDKLVYVQSWYIKS